MYVLLNVRISSSELDICHHLMNLNLWCAGNSVFLCLRFVTKVDGLFSFLCCEALFQGHSKAVNFVSCCFALLTSLGDMHKGNNQAQEFDHG